MKDRSDIAKPAGIASIDTIDADAEIVRLGRLFSTALAAERWFFAHEHHKIADEDSDAAADAAIVPTSALAERIAELPATTLPAMHVKALVAAWCHGSDVDQTVHEMCSRAAATDERVIWGLIRDLIGSSPERGPAVRDCEAAADRILALINSSPHTPSKAEIVATLREAQIPVVTLLARQLLDAGRKAMAADCHRGQFFEDTPEYAAADAAAEVCWASYHALRDHITAAQGFADIVPRAVVAYIGADLTTGGRMVELDDGDCFTKPACELIQAVLDLAGISLVPARAA